MLLSSTVCRKWTKLCYGHVCGLCAIECRVLVSNSLHQKCLSGIIYRLKLFNWVNTSIVKSKYSQYESLLNNRVSEIVRYSFCGAEQIEPGTRVLILAQYVVNAGLLKCFQVVDFCYLSGNPLYSISSRICTYSYQVKIPLTTFVYDIK